MSDEPQQTRTDFSGNVLSVGDIVAVVQPNSRSGGHLQKAKVVKFHPVMIEVHPLGGRYTCKVSHLKVMRINRVDHVEVPTARFQELLNDEAKLSALEVAGVDNWEWYGEAMATLGDDEDES